MHKIVHITVILTLLPLLIFAEANPDKKANDAQLSSTKLLDRLSFYNKFDGNIDASFANGEYRPSNPGVHFNYSEGLVGKGLLVGQETQTLPPQYLTKNNISSDTGTLSLWFKPKYDSKNPITSGKDYRWLFSSRGDNDRFYLQYKRTHLSLDYFMKYSTSGWFSNEWKHIVVTWNKDFYTMYINGIPVTNRKVKQNWGRFLGFGEFFTVGGYLYKGRESASGVIDELAAWKRTLNKIEIKSLYNLGLAKKPLIESNHPLLTSRSIPERQFEYMSNALENGSFEAGVSNWVIARIPKTFSPALPSFVSSGSHKDLISINNEGAQHGKNVLRLKLSSRDTVAPTIVQNTAEISTLAFALDPSNKHEASFWIRSESNEPYTVKYSIEGVRQTEQGDNSLSKKFRFNNSAGQWNLIKITGKPGKAYDDLFRLKIIIENISNKPTLYDLDSLNVSTLNSGVNNYAYKTDNPITGTISTNKLANIFTPNEPILLHVNLANQNEATAKSKLFLNIYDFNNKVISENILSKTLYNFGETSITHQVNTNRYGIYRAEIIRENGRLVDNITFTIIPTMQQHRSIGIHTVSDDYSLSIAKRLGFYWHRLWDNGKPTAWTSVQPVKQGEFNWEYSDDIVNKTLEHGLKPIGIISWPFYWERNWVDNNKPSWIHKKWNIKNERYPDIDIFDDPDFIAEWSNYVHGVVSHYADKIQYWELLNEPYRQAPAKWIAKVYEITIPIIKNANKKALILGPCTHIRKKWTEELISLGILNHIDVFSYHGYDMTPDNLRAIHDQSSRDGKKRLVFDTENSGSTSARNFCSHCPGNIFTGDHDYKESASKQVKSLLQSLGEGTDTYIYYWMTPYDAYVKHRSFLNYDGTLRSSAVAFTIASWLIGDIKSSSPLHINKDINAYLFYRTDGSSIAAIWVNGNNDLALKLTAFSKDIIIRDMMGNPLPINSYSEYNIPSDSLPIYIESEPSQLHDILGYINNSNKMSDP